MTLDVLGIYPYGSDLGLPDRTPPLGLAWIGAVLERAGYGVMMYDQQVEVEDFSAVVAAARPRLALLSGTSHGRFIAFDYARTIKEVSPETVVVYGGPHASFTAAETLARVPAIDIVGHGEGEDTCLELAAWKKAGGGRPEDLANIAGITFRGRDGELVTSAPRPRRADLDSLPLPARRLFPMERYRLMMDLLHVPGAIIMTTRGCPLMCAFCSESHFFGTHFYMRSAAGVADEIEEVMADFGVRAIQFFDSTFSLRRRHVEDFCEEVARRRLEVPWACQVRVNTVDKALLAKMRAAGCYLVGFGVESGDQGVLDSISKGIKLEQAVQVMEWCKEVGLATRVSFSLGHPGETYEQALTTNRFIRRHARFMTFIGYNPGVRIYPGTAVEAYARGHALLPPGFDWAAPYENADNEKLFRLKDNVPLLLQPQMGVEELRRLRVSFFRGWLLSPGYLVTKAVKALRGGEIGRLWRSFLRGLGFRLRTEEDRIRGVKLGS